VSSAAERRGTHRSAGGGAAPALKKRRLLRYNGSMKKSWLFAAAGTFALAVLLLGARIGSAPAARPASVPTLTSAAATPVPHTAVPQKAAAVPTRVW
jgi:hypothetical protein